MAPDNCVFCSIIAGRIPSFKVYEDQDVFAFLDIGPVSDGHTLVVPKEHYDRLDQCPPAIVAKVTGSIGRIAGAVVDAMAAEGYNVLCNNGRAAGQLVDHVHFHIIPRKTGDGVIGRWPKYEYPDGRAEAIVERICEKL